MVIVDERGGTAGLEGAKRRLSALRGRGVDCELALLEFGDYAIVGNGPNNTTVMVGVELKTSRDILTSLRSGRLKGHQVPGMVQMYDGRAWLLTEGIWRERSGDWEVYQGTWQTFSAGSRTVQMADIESWILSTVTFGGLMYWHAATGSDTARFIACLEKCWSKDYDDHTKSYDVIYRRPPDRVAFTEPSDFVKMVSVPDKVGFQKAKALEAAYGGDFEQLMAASEDDLQDVDGVGKTIARTLFKTLHPKRGAA